MKKKLMLVFAMSITFIPSAFAGEAEETTQLGEKSRLSEYDPRSLQCNRRADNSATEGGTPARRAVRARSTAANAQ